jgi:hypothetical protein
MLKNFIVACTKKLKLTKDTETCLLKQYSIDRKLDIDQQNRLEGIIIRNDEILKELKIMKAGKSPGIDGLQGKEFYLSFWDVLGDDLVETINNVFFKIRGNHENGSNFDTF